MPLSALYEAAFKYQQLSGIDAAVEWHERELARLRASRAAIEGPCPKAATTAPAEAEAEADARAPVQDKLQLAVEALEFYADELSWRKGRGGKASLIDDDNKGDLARETLAKLESGGEGAAQ